MTRRILACLVVVASGAAFASDHPTDPREMDEMCEEMGAAPDPSAPPADRLWFSENCVCEDEIGCGYASSRRFAERRKAAGQAEAKLQEAERKAASARDAEDQRKARGTCSAYVECLREHASDAPACAQAEATFEYDCSSGLRDVEACGRVIAGIRKSPAEADCSSALKSPTP